MRCPRCGEELDAYPVEERAYGYGGYKDYEEFVGIEVYCRTLGCGILRRYDIDDLEQLAIEDVGDPLP